MSYRPVNEPEDFLFVSDKAYFEQEKAIRGGIPVCWPWFGADIKNAENPAHGFARNNFWSVVSTDVMKNGDTQIKLEFVDSSETRKIWPHSFCLSLEITIGDALTLNLCTRNTGTDAFFITEALHSYFNVGDAMQVQVLGLEHTEYFDKTDGFIKVCKEGALTFSEETDQIHTDIKHQLKIVDPSFNRTINISLSGNKNVVVWNPWAKKSSDMSDLEDDDYKHFICVEIANAASDRVEFPAGSEHTLMTSYTVV